MSREASRAAARNDGRAFEYFAADHHRRKYGHTVWHASVVPESELFAAGVFHSYNSRRMLRNARLREARNPERLTSPYVDDGIDFLAKQPAEDPSKRAAYYPGQAKNYATKSVCANDLSGFYRNMVKMRAPGYLYTTTRLNINLREDLMQNPDWYTHERLEFTAPTAGAVPQANADETVAPMRSYQLSAVCEMLKRLVAGGEKDTKMILHVGCGLGKTLIAGKLLADIRRRWKPQLYVCIAPLRVSVANLKDRLMPFFNATASCSSDPQFRALLVDSDAGGTTDPAYIGSVLKAREPVVVFATFESFFGLLTQEFGEYLTDEDAFLLVDEMHNLTREQCRIVNGYQTSLLMSATVPEELKEVLDATEVYRYTMADGIRDGYLCDYEVYLPLVKRAPSATPTPADSEAATPATAESSAAPDDADSDADSDDEADAETPDGDAETPDPRAEGDDRGRTVADVEFPEGFPTDDVTAKALFLCTGMLQTGSRRCIAYLRTTDECAQFVRMFRRVSVEYHGLRPFIDQIDHTVGGARRSEILRAFQADSEQHDVFVIASVRILDEAVDVPRCDSEFIGHVGDRTSDIRTVQRLQRGGRLDHTNPNKRNCLFVWTEEWSRAINALTLMRQEDLAFHKKLRTVSASYDRLGQPAVERETRTCTEELQAYSEVRCITLHEMWMRRVEEYREWYEKFGRKPSPKSLDPIEKKIAIWANNQHTQKNKGILPDMRTAILTKIPGWIWITKRTFKRAVKEWHDMYAILGRMPKITSPDPIEKNIAVWAHNQRSLKMSGNLSNERISILTTTPGWSWSSRTKFNIMIEECRKWYEKFNRSPSTISPDLFEKRIGQWVSSQRQLKQNGELSDERIAALSAINGWKWHENKPFDIMLNSVLSWYNQFGHMPRINSSNPDEKRLKQWLNIQQWKKNKGKLEAERISKMAIIPGWSQ